VAILNDRYPLKAKSDNVFLFESIGRSGKYTLVGSFSPILDIDRKRNTQSKNFNFAFGLLKTSEDGSTDIDDKEELHNGDMEKIFNTVTNEIYLFIKRNPLNTVTISGSTPTRTRKYRQLISKNHELISKHFDLFGILPQRGIAKFNPNSTENYVSFLIENKIN
jgi:hypothetical protein